MKRRVLTAEETRSRIRAAVARPYAPEAKVSFLDVERMKRARPSLVRSLPPWVGRFGLLAGSGFYCLWCEPDSSPAETFPGQMVLDIPSGRYMVEILDSATALWVSRESAAGGPLVAGLPYTGSSVLVRIRFRS